MNQIYQPVFLLFTITSLSFTSKSVFAQCEPKFENKDEFTNTLIKGYGGEIIPSPVISDNNVSIYYYLVEAIDESGKRVVSGVLTFKNYYTKDKYTAAQTYLQKVGQKEQFIMKLKGFPIPLTSANTDASLDVKEFANQFIVTVTMQSPVSNKVIEVLQEYPIETIRVEIGGKQFDRKTKNKKAVKIMENLQCVEPMEAAVEKAIIEEALKKQ